MKERCNSIYACQSRLESGCRHATADARKADRTVKGAAVQNDPRNLGTGERFGQVVCVGKEIVFSDSQEETEGRGSLQGYLHHLSSVRRTCFLFE